MRPFQKRANLSLKKLFHIEKGGRKNENGRIASPESIPMHVNYYFIFYERGNVPQDYSCFCLPCDLTQHETEMYHSEREEVNTVFVCFSIRLWREQHQQTINTAETITMVATPVPC